MTHLTYDPRKHITAGELRRMGFYLPEILEDSFFVRRAAVGFNPREDFFDSSATLELAALESFVGAPCLADAI